MDPFMFWQFSFKKDAVRSLRIETRTRDRSPDTAHPPSHRYRSKARYCTATDYGPCICIRVRFLYRTVHGRILILIWRIKIKLLGDRIRVQYSDPDLPGLVRLIWLRGQSWKTTTGPKSGLKIKVYLKIKISPPQVQREPGSANCGSGG